MLMLPDIHICCSTKVFLIFPRGEINKLLTYKSVVVKFPTSLLNIAKYPSVNMDCSFKFVNTNSQKVKFD